MNNLGRALEEGLDAMSDVMRFVLPAMAFIILIVCTVSLLRNRPRVTTMAHLINLANGDEIPLAHWETSIGRSSSCDICLAYNTVSRFHAVIARRKGKWMIYDTQSKPGIMINEEKIEREAELCDGDNIILGTAVLTFRASDAPRREQEVKEEYNSEYIENETYNIPMNFNRSEQSAVHQFEDFSSTSKDLPALVNESQSICLYLTEDSSTIGSASDAELSCDLSYIAPYHARISRSRDGWILENLGSKLGVWINGAPLKSAQLLFDGDKILLGRLQLTFYEKYSG